MSRLASADDFFQRVDAQGNPVANTGTWYTQYRRYDFFAQRADFIQQRYPIAGLAAPKKVLVVGCAFGYLVEALVARGYDAWGIEASDWARQQSATAENGVPAAVQNRIVLANAANRGQLNTAASAAGLSGNQRWSLIAIEDVHPVCTDLAEVQLALTELRRQAAVNQLCHFITCAKPETVGDLNARFPGLLWLSRTEWRAAINSPSEVMVDAEGQVEFRDASGGLKERYWEGARLVEVKDDGRPHKLRPKKAKGR